MPSTTIEHKFPLGAKISLAPGLEAKVLGVWIDTIGAVGYTLSTFNQYSGVFMRHNVIADEVEHYEILP